MNFQKSNVLELKQTHYTELNTELRTLTNKAQLNVGFSSVLLTVVATIQFSDEVALYRVGVAGIFIVWLGIFLFSYLAVVPRNRSGAPLKPTRADIEEKLGMNDDDYYWWLIKSYHLAITINTEVANTKAKLFRYSAICVFAEIALIAIIALTA